MPIMRLPGSLALKDGIFRGDNEAQVDLWKRGQAAGEWQRMRSARNPEGVEIAPNIVGIPVAISEWKEVIRGFLAKMLGRKEEGTETISLNGGKTQEVQKMMQGVREAFLAWGKEAGVTFDEELIAKLFPENEGFEMLGVKNDLCLMHGKTESLVPKPPPGAISQPKNKESIHPYQRFIDEVEAKFAYHINLADYPEGTNIPGLECLETEHAKRALAAFREAEAMGISLTQMYIPEKPQGVVSLILQAHPESGQRDKNIIHEYEGDLIPKVQSEIFRLLYCLRKKINNPCILVEGTPYDEDYWSNDHGKVLIPGLEALRKMTIAGTPLCVESEEGQKLLCEHPELLLDIMRPCVASRVTTSYKLVSPINFPAIRGAEHSRFREMYREWERIDQIEEHFFAKYLHNRGRDCHARVQRDPSSQEIVYVNGKQCRYSDLLRELHNLLRSYRAESQLHEEREEYVTSRMQENVPVVPHLIYGAAHCYSLLNRYAQKDLGVIITTPASLPFQARIKRENCWFGTVNHPNYLAMLDLLKYLGGESPE